MLEVVLLHRAEGRADGFNGDRIDVTAECGHAKLMGFAYRGAGAHKRVEYRNVSEVVLLIKRLGEVILLGQHGTQQDAAKHGAKAFSPPFVNMINGAVNFLPPALALGELRKELERESVRFDEVCRYSSVVSSSASGISKRRGRGRRETWSAGEPLSRQARNACSRPAPGLGTVLGISSLVWRLKE